jgi:hypothetical protein
MSGAIAIVLKERPEIVILSAIPESTFDYFQAQFTDMGYGDFIGFYDWLRNPDDLIIGVRLHVLGEELEDLKNTLIQRKYIQISEATNGIDIFFSEDKSVLLERSADQEFDFAAAYQSENGTLALLFGIAENVKLQLLKNSEISVHAI